MDFALLLVFTAAIAVGVVAAVVRTWSLHSRLYSLEDRFTVMEGALTREVKSRAGQERWKKPDKDKELVAELVKTPAPPVRKNNWWETSHPRSVG